MRDMSDSANATGASTHGALTAPAGVPALRHVDESSARPRGGRGARRTGWRTVWTTLLAAVAGAALMLLFLRLFDAMAPSFAWVHNGGAGTKAVAIGLLLLTVLVVLGLHESGHVLGGRLGGFRFIAIVVGPVQVVRTGGRLQVGLNRRLGRAGGMALCGPLRWDGDRAFRRAFRRYSAGGPLTSLLAGSAATAAAVHLMGSGGATASPWGSLLYVGGVLSIGIGLITLIPYRMPGGLASDGAQFLRFRERDSHAGGSPATAEVATSLLSLAQTQRPRDWDSELVAQVSAAPASDQPTDLDVVARLLLYYHALDRGTTAEASARLQRAIEVAAVLGTATGDRIRRGVALEAAIFESVWCQDADAAQQWLAGATGLQSIDPHGLLLATAAMAAARGSRAEAARALTRAATLARRDFFPSTMLLQLATTERLTALLG